MILSAEKIYTTLAALLRSHPWKKRKKMGGRADANNPGRNVGRKGIMKILPGLARLGSLVQ